MSLEKGARDSGRGRIPGPRGESLGPKQHSGGIKELAPSSSRGEHVLFSLFHGTKDGELPDPIGEMVDFYRQGANLVGKLQTAARVMDDIVEGPQKKA